MILCSQIAVSKPLSVQQFADQKYFTTVVELYRERCEQMGSDNENNAIKASYPQTIQRYHHLFACWVTSNSQSTMSYPADVHNVEAQSIPS